MLIVASHPRFSHAAPKRFRWGALLCVLGIAISLAVGVPVARAATVDLGVGQLPSVAVDRAGTAYIAYNGLEPNYPVVHYCKLPRGASVCAQSVTLAPGGGSTSAPYVFVDAGGTVRLLTNRYGFASGPFSQDLLYTSPDGGVTFGPAVSVGTVTPFGGEAVAGPGASISIVNGASATHAYQDLPVDGSSAGEAFVALSQSYPYESSVGMVNATTPLVTFNDGHASPDTTAFSVYKGAGSLNDTANWTPAAVVAPGAQGHLAGPWLMLRSLIGGTHLELRMFTGTAFSGPVKIPASSGASVDSALALDRAQKTLNAVWGNTDKLYFWQTDVVPSATVPNAAVVATDPSFSALRLAVADDRKGLAVWGTASAGVKHIHAVALAPPPAVDVARSQRGTRVSGTVVQVPVGAKLRLALITGKATGSVPQRRLLGAATITSARKSTVAFTVKLNPRGRTALSSRKRLKLTVRAIIIVGGRKQTVTSPVTLKR